MADKENWWEGPGNYTGGTCANCGRERVCLVEAPDGTERAVCEKCGWDQEANDYATTVTFSASWSKLADSELTWRDPGAFTVRRHQLRPFKEPKMSDVAALMRPEDIPEDVWENNLIEAMCLTWRHDFGLDRQETDGFPVGATAAERDSLRRQMRQLVQHHVRPAILAERERCAKLIENFTPIRPAFETEDEGGQKWPHPAEQMPIYSPAKLAAAIRGPHAPE